MKRDYECLFILRPDLADEVIEQEIKTVTDFMVAEGGEVCEESRWGKRRLAHSIKKQRYGIYTLFFFSAETTFIKALERKFRLNENVLKSMTIIRDGSKPGKTLPQDMEPRKPVEEVKANTDNSNGGEKPATVVQSEEKSDVKPE